MLPPLHRDVLRLYQRATGRRILDCFDELVRTQWLGRDELLALQHSKLQRLVEYAYQYVPHYRCAFDQAGFRPAELREDPASFFKIPIVTKEYIRDHSDEFITTDPIVRKTLQKHTTSGTTGEPLVFWEDNNYRDHVTADILRHLTWCGWRLGEPHAYLWGHGSAGALSHRLRASLMDLALNRFVAAGHLLSDDHLEALTRQIRPYRPRLLFSFASALFVFAQFAHRKRLDNVRLLAMYSSGEVLYPYQRKVIEETFGCPVFDRYGTLEMGGIACECEAHAGMHISAENCYVEVLDGNEPVRDGQPGEIVVTNLNNYGFPFIRYRLADVVQERSGECSCGRQSPRLEHVQGRVVDIFRTARGDYVWDDLETFEVPGIKQYQVVQKALDLVLVRLAKDDRLQQTDLENIEHSIKKTMGSETQVQFEFPDHLPRTSAGKYRYAYSELSAPQLDRASGLIH